VAAGTVGEAACPGQCVGCQADLAVAELGRQGVGVVEAVLVERGSSVVAQAGSGGSAASSLASCCAATSACPAGTRRLTRLIRATSAAVTARPVRMRSIARLCPISRGSRRSRRPRAAHVGTRLISVAWWRASASR